MVWVDASRGPASVECWSQPTLASRRLGKEVSQPGQKPHCPSLLARPCFGTRAFDPYIRRALPPDRAPGTDREECKRLLREPCGMIECYQRKAG
jgi:hypothetical protein